MTPGTVINLIKSISTRSGGLLATYKLDKAASIPVLILSHAHCLTEEGEIAAIDHAAALAKQEIKRRYSVQRVILEGKK